MKKILILFLAIGITATVYASRNGWYTGSHGYPYRVTISSTTSTTLFTNDGEIEDVQYDNRTGYDVILTTFQITQSTTYANLDNVTNYKNRRVLQSGKWPPLKITNTNYRFAISSVTCVEGNDFYIDINK